jgi:hypothetical protein
MSRFWLTVLAMIALGGGLVIAPSLPATAQFPTLETSEQSQIDSAFPEPIGAAVLQATSVQASLPLEQLTLTQAIPKVWSDGCLGLAPPDQMCTAVLVRGWQVTVAHQRQEWVYRTSATGQKIVLDPAGSHLSRLIVPPAEQIPANQLPPKVDRSVVFREIRSGGFAGITEETRLYKDGRLMKGPFSKVPKPTDGGLLRRLSRAKVKAFVRVLETYHFGQFDGLNYPALKGGADYFNITLGNWQTTVQYTSMSKELPADLVQIQQAWRSLVAAPQ